MRQRLRQFRNANVAPTPGDFALAEEWLTTALLALFRAQHPRDIVHSAATARWLLVRGHADADLLTAAFVHDIAKGPQRRRDRVAYVLLAATHFAQVSASPRSRFEVRRALDRTERHSAAGADVLREVGATGRAVHLTLHHHDPAGDDGMLALLQRADALN